jgi:hypothetical protein
MEDNEDKKQQTASAAEDPVRAQNEALARPGAYKTNSIAAYMPGSVINSPSAHPTMPTPKKSIYSGPAY